MPPVVLYISRLVVDAHGPWLLCEQAGIDYVLEDVDLALGEHRSPAFRAMNPHGTVPALRDGDVCVWEAHAIMRHLCRCYPEAARYYPQQPEALASMEQVLDWRNTSLFRNISAVAGPLLGFTAPDESRQAAGRAALTRAKDGDFAVLQHKFLMDRPYIAGHSITIADFSVVTALKLLDATNLSLPPSIEDYAARVTQATDYKRLADGNGGYGINMYISMKRAWGDG
eukprot:TRINITY_DN3850_c0_g1_i2.p1 TRINITY_DN3850_c0_g1~~TRINITY_DN3850_c0_g1_i2.p1  ORF type:complete len:227 (+),score=20.69 TRINITY_DN3850_c0_g1_i2:42-722(+)